MPTNQKKSCENCAFKNKCEKYKECEELRKENAKFREFKDNAIEIKRLEDLNKNYEYLIKQRDIYNKELQEENKKLKKELSEHKEICCCFDNEVLRLENAKLKEQLQKAEKTLQEIEGDWTTEETRIKISKYFNQQAGDELDE